MLSQLLDVGVEAGSLASEYGKYLASRTPTREIMIMANLKTDAANAVVLISDKNHNYRLMLSIGF